MNTYAIAGCPSKIFLQLAHFARIFLRIIITYFLICVPIRYGYYVAKKPSRFDDNMQVVPKRKMNILPPEHGVWKSQKIVSFNIASEASYVYILSGRKLIKNAKNGPFWRVFENLKLAVKQCYQTGQF